MTQLREVAYLELDTFSLAGTADINANFSRWVFRNINMRNVMGDMWNKYDKFVIKLQQLNTNGTSVYGTTGDNTIAYNMAGLDWINLYYETARGSQKWAPVFQHYVTSTTANFQYIYPTVGGVNFRKGQPIVDLEFQIYSLSQTNLNVNTTATYNNNQMTFTIEPAEDDENEMATMVLNTSNNVTVAVPSSNNNVFTYNNFNIKDVCREFWDKYDDFEIIYASYIATRVGATTVPIATQNVAFRGLNFVNNNTGLGSGSFATDIAVMGGTKFSNVVSSVQTSDTMVAHRVQFKKSSDTTTLEVQFRTFDNSAISTFAVSNRQWQGLFYIKPIRKELGCCDKGTLVLSGAGMTTTPADFGFTNASVTNTTWRNINLRNVCRGFWDKYEKFHIFYSQSQNNVTTTDATEQCLIMYMKGLNFETPWNIDPNVDSQTWTIGGIMEGHTITTQAIFNTTYGNTRGIMFHKTADIVDINLYVTTVDGPLAATGCLNGTFIFTIVGVEE